MIAAVRTPQRWWRNHGSPEPLRPTSLERTASETHARIWWQSRSTLTGRRADPPQLTDLAALARKIRAQRGP